MICLEVLILLCYLVVGCYFCCVFYYTWLLLLFWLFWFLVAFRFGIWFLWVCFVWDAMVWFCVWASSDGIPLYTCGRLLLGLLFGLDYWYLGFAFADCFLVGWLDLKCGLINLCALIFVFRFIRIWFSLFCCCGLIWCFAWMLCWVGVIVVIWWLFWFRLFALCWFWFFIRSHVCWIGLWFMIVCVMFGCV